MGRNSNFAQPNAGPAERRPARGLRGRPLRAPAGRGAESGFPLAAFLALSRRAPFLPAEGLEVAGPGGAAAGLAIGLHRADQPQADADALVRRVEPLGAALGP